MIEKVVHKNTLKRLHKEVNHEIIGWTKAYKNGWKQLQKCEMKSVYRLVLAIGLLGLPNHIDKLKARRNRISKMIRKKK